MPGHIRIGTSGWNYKHWKGTFYPEDLSQEEWFSHYAAEFPTVEINNTFYNQVGDETFDQWRQQAPSGFLCAVKANRYLTHLRKLNEPKQPLETFLDGARRLHEHLGPLLYQLPPNWKKNLDRLKSFAEVLPAELNHVIEFRNRDWLADDTYDLLAEHKIALCVHDMLPNHPRRVTGNIAYVRFHGAGKQYEGTYSPSRLRPWASWITEAAAERDVYVYFNNDAHGHAVADAHKLTREVEGLGGTVVSPPTKTGWVAVWNAFPSPGSGERLLGGSDQANVHRPAKSA